MRPIGLRLRLAGGGYLPLLLGACASLLLGACLPSTGDRGLQQELAAAQREASLERERVHALEARLTRLEARSEDQTRVQNAALPSEPGLEQRLDVLIALNQQLLHETRASQQPAAVVPTAVARSEAPRTSTVGPECNTGLTTEQKVLELVLQLRGERSPWRVDGLSYEESQALRLLLRAERELDEKNPWQ
jgi:hypothetical protein